MKAAVVVTISMALPAECLRNLSIRSLQRDMGRWFNMKHSKASPFQTKAAAQAFAGVHLAGSNTSKTSLVVLTSTPFGGPLKIGKVYEKIGSFGTFFSDERLVEILTHTGPYAEVFVDCPLTVPPCVACQRPACPGVVQCEDVAVAYMLKVSAQTRRRGARKNRPINPQSQRLWDVLQWAGPAEERREPSYSANLAPLVARARTLQRRLNSLAPQIALRETAVVPALQAITAAVGLDAAAKSHYRNFEEGRSCRRQILAKLVAAGWLNEDIPPTDDFEADEWDVAPLITSVETFNAAITAVVAALYHAGYTAVEPSGYVEGEGWVYLPHFHTDVAHPLPGEGRG